MNLRPLLFSWALCGFLFAPAPLATAQENPATAASLYQRAAESLPERAKSDGEIFYPFHRNNEAKRPVSEAVREGLKLAQPTLALLSEAADAPSPSPAHTLASKPTISSDAWQILPFLPLSQALLDLEEGRDLTAIAQIRSSLLIARRLETEADPLMNALMGIISERTALNFIAAQLLQLSPQARLELEATLKALPAPRNLATAVENERQSPALQELVERIRTNRLRETDELARSFLGDAFLDADQAAKAVHAYHSDLRRLSPLLAPPAAKAYRLALPWLREVEVQRGTEHLSPTALRGFVAVLQQQAEAEIYLAMILAALEILRDGPQAAEKSRDPYSGKPFAYEKTAKGFTLTVEPLKAHTPITLTFR